MRCQLDWRLLFWREWGHGTVPDVEYGHSVPAFVQRVDDSVGVRFLAEMQMAKLPVFWKDCAAPGKSL